MALNLSKPREGACSLPGVTFQRAQGGDLRSELGSGLIELAFHKKQVGMLHVRILIFHRLRLVSHLPALAIELIASLKIPTPGLDVGQVGNGRRRIDAIIDGFEVLPCS